MRVFEPHQINVLVLLLHHMAKGMMAEKICQKVGSNMPGLGNLNSRETIEDFALLPQNLPSQKEGSGFGS